MAEQRNYAQRARSLWWCANCGVQHDDAGGPDCLRADADTAAMLEHDYAQRLIREHRGSTVGEE